MVSGEIVIKRCRKCDRDLPVTAFAKDCSKWDGLHEELSEGPRRSDDLMALAAGGVMRRDVAKSVSERYFGGHPVLFARQAQQLGATIQAMEEMVDAYNETARRVRREDLAVDMADLQSSSAGGARDILRLFIDYARANALQNIGEDQAARDLLMPHWLEGDQQAE